MDTEYLKSVAMKIISAALLIGIIFYVLYHITGGFTTHIETLPVKYGEVRESVSASAYVFRDEEIVQSSEQGLVNYNFTDGEKVRAGAKLADVYGTAKNSEIAARVLMINKTIDLLEKSSLGDDTTIADVVSSDGEIFSLILGIKKYTSGGQYDFAAARADELLIDLNRRTLVLSDNANYSEKISSLTSEKNQLLSGISGSVQSVYTSTPGYFESRVDGFENIFSYSKIESISAAELSEMISASPSQSAGAIGKIIKSSVWYLAFPISKNELDGFEVGYSYNGIFPYNSDRQIKLKLERIEKESDDENALLIFSANTLPRNFDFMRTQKVEIVKNSYSGLRFPAYSLRRLDDMTGAYILIGNTVYFRLVDIVGEADGYVYAADNTESIVLFGDDEDEKNDIVYKGISLYDNVIVSGAVGLRHGKIVEG